MREFTTLKERTLWFDGDSTFEPDGLADIILKGTKLKKGVYVSSVTPEIERFNEISEYELACKTANRPLDFDWNIPQKYKDMNLRTYILRLLEAELERNTRITDTGIDERLARVDLELDMFYKHNLHNLLRTSIYIIDTFREKNVVWGVGRGSACGSYILYLIGIHDIDSIDYDLDISDFLR